MDQQLIICSNIDLAIGRKFVLSSGLCLKFVEEEWLFRRSAPSDRGSTDFGFIIGMGRGIYGLYHHRYADGDLCGYFSNSAIIYCCICDRDRIMIPGELGTFDVMMIMGMGSLNIPRKRRSVASAIPAILLHHSVFDWGAFVL